jgi:hypothetical protein
MRTDTVQHRTVGELLRLLLVAESERQERGRLRIARMSLVHPGGGLPGGTAKSMLWKRLGASLPR